MSSMRAAVSVSGFLQSPNPCLNRHSPYTTIGNSSVKLKKVKVAHTRLTSSERRVLEVIPVPGSQPAGDVSYKPGGRLPILFARPAVTLTTLKRAATNFTAW